MSILQNQSRFFETLPVAPSSLRRVSPLMTRKHFFGPRLVLCYKTNVWKYFRADPMMQTF